MSLNKCDYDFQEEKAHSMYSVFSYQKKIDRIIQNLVWNKRIYKWKVSSFSGPVWGVEKYDKETNRFVKLGDIYI